MPLAPGRRLGVYEILAPLGSGGMGEVYRAKDTRLGRDVALKLLPAHLAEDRERLARLEREARAVAALNHPNIVVLHSLEEADGQRFLTLELVEGRSLAERVRPGGLPAEEVLALALPIGEALVAAHGKGIVHRDLKPANVMVTTDGRIKVLDFGLAKLAESSAPNEAEGPTRSMALSVTGDVMGTPGYMSPEQIRGDTVDARSDLFSFGIVLYELATGRRPFDGRSAADVTSAILRDEPPAMTRLRADLPGDLASVVGRCLEKDPARRVPTAIEVVRNLRELQRRIESGRTVTVVGARGGADAGPAPAQRRSLRRAGIVVASVVVVAGVVTAALVLPRRKAPAARTPADSQRTVAVLEFENLTGDASFDWMRRGVAELLGSALVQSAELDVFDAQRLGELAAGEGAAATPNAAFLARHGIRRAVAGTILRSGGEMRLQGRILDTGSGRLVRACEAAGPVDSGLFHVVGRLIPELQVALEVNLTGDREAEAWLREITTTSADAYRLYLRGHQALLASHWKEAASSYEQALELDSMFVAARTELSGAYWNLGDATALSLTRAAMRRLRDRAGYRDRLRIDLLESVVGGDPPAIVRTASELVRLYPENRFYTYLLGRGYYTSQQYRMCLDTLRPLVEQRYGWAWTYALSARSSWRLGDPASARRTFELGLEVTQDPELAYAYVRFLREQGDRERARSLVEEALRSPMLRENPVAEGELRVERARDLDAAGDRAGARAELELVKRILPTDDEAWPAADSMMRALGVK